MPMPVAAKAGIVVASVAVAAAIALYESPEFRRVAEDLRRRIAIALHSLGDSFDPTRDGPRFNRPEDAEGFMMSQGGPNNAVDADDESRRRQREELMYWNMKLEEKQRGQESASASAQPSSPSRKLTFDDILREDQTADRGSIAYNTGSNPWGGDQQGIVRRRGAEGVRGLGAAILSNPFGDEYGIDLDEHSDVQEKPNALAPGREELMSDIYSATPHDGRSVASHTLSPQSKPVAPEVLFDFDSQPESKASTAASATVDHDHEAAPSVSARDGLTSLDRELPEDEYMTAGQDSRQEAYESIQAWAYGSNPSFYSPLPVSPPAPISEPELINQGALTPADSASVAGSGVDIGDDGASTKTEDFDVMSEDEDGVLTPTSWSDVGSDVSESAMHN
ncbi:hypothetical protein B0T18DRAFT_412062 [Schizothecium vesticola]|uniref:Uncharacterized protein n=1 Tax=Schizothecium vesticola TaxID=314040 RepID=A0AA40EW55_9PEZI|nr:hypothetical protein B0T18DRAFT_412062 [Schizothecium vesticola]